MSIWLAICLINNCFLIYVCLHFDWYKKKIELCYAGEVVMFIGDITILLLGAMLRGGDPFAALDLYASICEFQSTE